MGTQDSKQRTLIKGQARQGPKFCTVLVKSSSLVMWSLITEETCVARESTAHAAISVKPKVCKSGDRALRGGCCCCCQALSLSLTSVGMVGGGGGGYFTIKIFDGGGGGSSDGLIRNVQHHQPHALVARSLARSLGRLFRLASME